MSVRFLLLALAAPIALLALVACGSDDNNAGRFDFGGGDSFATTGVESFAPEPEFALEEFPADVTFDQGDFDDGAFTDEAFTEAAADEAALGEFAPGDPPISSDAAQVVDRLVINNGNLSVAVDDVIAAVDQVRAIAESIGGFVEQLMRSGEGRDQFATLTIRVPQDQFFTVLERVGALGEVRDESVGSENVTAQFIDLEARLRIATEEEVRLIELFDMAESVTDVLIIESELGRVRSEVERFQGQLNFLTSRVELSSLTVSLFPPSAPFVDPPSAQLAVAVGDVEDTVGDMRVLVDAAGGIVDRVILSDDGSTQQAFVILRVPAAEFDATVAALEREGEVQFKQVEVGGESPPDVEPSEEPDSLIELALSQEDGFDWWLVIAIVVPIGAVLILLGGIVAMRRRCVS